MPKIAWRTITSVSDMPIWSFQNSVAMEMGNSTNCSDVRATRSGGLDWSDRGAVLPARRVRYHTAAMDALATGYGLIEGPLWRPGEGLYFSDVPNGGVHRLSPAGDVVTVVPHRRGIGGLA